MKIIIALPSKNEEKNISRIALLCDEFLFKNNLFSTSLLLNLDCSTDNTIDAFLETDTCTEKISISVAEGKGRAMIKAIQYTYEIKGDILIFVDTDIEVAPHILFEKFIYEISKNNVDVVIPWRKPIWNALDMTYHLCLPIIRAVFQSEVHETIGGELALSYDACKFLLKEDWPIYAMNYGVDFYLTAKCIQNLNTIEVPFEFEKGNDLRSYQSLSNNEIIFGNKFYEVLYSVLHTSADYLNNNSYESIEINIKKPIWTLDKIPKNDELIALSESTSISIQNTIRSKSNLNISKKLIKMILYFSNNENQLKKGIDINTWTSFLILLIDITRNNYFFNQNEILFIEQIFLSRTVNHYTKHLNQDDWFLDIEKQANLMVSFFKGNALNV